ncbi:tripartite tricarboxylate transporter substrate binding protein [Ideonella sp. A 288]|uniref:tripartite tricarboxylate transporter substrate binding protein n=1 Tax=Ideonella sp. A 288 TaxID=1962181 RepID=UPI000B4B94F8|nr:tripartite tricarboxylate transporter substrate binding protein [Ideonella sp. A 288]
MTPILVRTVAWLSGLLLAASAAVAQPLSAKPVNLMVPYPAGGLSDAIARVVEKPLSKAVGQMVIVENVGGVGGAIGAQKVLGAPADGHYLYQGSPNELILSPLALSAVKYKSEDWRLVQMIGAFPIAILARKGLPANNVDELVALARKADAEGRPLTYASVGIGSFYHVLGEHFAQTIGARMTHVPYKGGAPVFQDLGGELVDIAIFVVGTQITGLVEQGRMKVLATLAPAGKVEAPFLKQYPSVNDSKSVRNFAFNTWTGYFVRKDTPEPVVQALHKALGATMADAAVRSQLEQLGGTVPPTMTLAEASREYEGQTARFRTIAKAIKLDAQ